jgi:hypothetical protein
MKHQLVACPNCGFRRTIHPTDPARKYSARTGGPAREKKQPPTVKVIIRRKKTLHPAMSPDNLQRGQENGD